MPEADQICPWCQTEIVWDPEIGPEDTCPNCFNELGDYRGIQIKLNKSGDHILFNEEEDEAEDGSGGDLELDDWDDEHDNAMDEYEEGVQRLLDRQEEAPECSVCRSLMLYAGAQTAPHDYVPYVHDDLQQPLLKAAYSTQVYVCPSCFKTEHILSEQDRLHFIQQLQALGGKGQ